jgi:predicted ArsR family transcriptional regulator
MRSCSEVSREVDQGAKAQRYRLLGDPRRLAIVEALTEGPRQIPELARLLDVHPATVRAHLEKLRAAGVLEEVPGIPAGRGRPSKRYQLREPLLAGDPEVRLFIAGLVSLIRTACGEATVDAAEQEGARRGRELGPPFRHPSVEQAVRVVVETLQRLSFAPSPPVWRDQVIGVDIRHCPFGVDPDDPDGAVVCAFHAGLVRGLAEEASGEGLDVRLRPFVAPDRCRVELCFRPATVGGFGGAAPDTGLAPGRAPVLDQTVTIV